MPSLKTRDIYCIEDKEWVITNLWERTGGKKGKIVFNAVDEIDLDNSPPPRKDLHQNRYGICACKQEEMFLKILSPAFYRRSKKFYKILKPYAKELFVESYFDDENKILSQPKLGKSIKEEKLKWKYVEYNVEKIKNFIKAVKESGNSDVVSCFDFLDILPDNFMIDIKRRNLYLIDFDPYPRANPDSAWENLIGKIRNDI